MFGTSFIIARSIHAVQVVWSCLRDEFQAPIALFSHYGVADGHGSFRTGWNEQVAVVRPPNCPPRVESQIRYRPPFNEEGAERTPVSGCIHAIYIERDIQRRRVRIDNGGGNSLGAVETDLEVHTRTNRLPRAPASGLLPSSASGASQELGQTSRDQRGFG